jgi:hypothetical protein
MSHPSEWDSVANRERGGLTKARFREKKVKEKRQRYDMVRMIAADAMKLAGPLPSREVLREITVRGLLAVATSKKTVDARARVVAFKAVLDHTDKMADRDQDYSKMTDKELEADVLRQMRFLVAKADAEAATTTVMPQLSAAPANDADGD